MLQAVGIGEFEERVYRALLRRPGRSAASLAREFTASQRRVRRGLESLAESNLVDHCVDVGWIPASPDGALEALIRRHESELAQLRAETPMLLGEFRSGHLARQPAELLEVVVGREEIHRRAQEARRLTREELLSFDKPPYIAPDTFDELGEESVLLDRDLCVRAIYCSEALTASPWPDRMQQIRRLAGQGEQARMLPSLPIKLTIYDHRLALVPLTVDARATDSMVVVHESGLLDGLIALFEAHWNVAHPIDELPSGVPASALTDGEQEVLATLAVGVTDEAIARMLGVSTRTVRRRILGILDALEAGSRFQAGAAAARKGWV